MREKSLLNKGSAERLRGHQRPPEEKGGCDSTEAMTHPEHSRATQPKGPHEAWGLQSGPPRLFCLPNKILALLYYLNVKMAFRPFTLPHLLCAKP